jgi:protein-disulfide isomerase
MRKRKPGTRRPSHAPAISAVIVLVVAAPQIRAEGLTAQQGEALRKQNNEILSELRDIHALIDRMAKDRAVADAHPSAPRVRVPVSQTEPAIGKSDAPWTLIEYTDYQCPFCRQFHTASYEEIKKNYIDTGKMRFISRDFPLDMHENAARAALAARCAGDQGAFWELRAAMITNADKLQAQDIDSYAAHLNLDVKKIDACVKSGPYQAQLEKQLADGHKAGITGTPSFVLGKTGTDAVEGIRIVGSMSYATFDAHFKDAVAAVGTE